jgi:uncharacterized protein
MTTCGVEIRGHTLHRGTARGDVLTLTAPLSFWGGTDVESGRIIDERHPQRGVTVAGRVLVMHSGRGSSSSSSVLAEQIRRGVSPSAIVLGEVDTIIVMGAIVAAELYDVHMPIVRLTGTDFDRLTDRLPVRVDATPDGAMVRGDSVEMSGGRTV